MITDHDRKLLEVLADERLGDPAQSAVIRILLAEHDRLKARADMLGKVVDECEKVVDTHFHNARDVLAEARRVMEGGDD